MYVNINDKEYPLYEKHLDGSITLFKELLILICA